MNFLAILQWEKAAEGAVREDLVVPQDREIPAGEAGRVVVVERDSTLVRSGVQVAREETVTLVGPEDFRAMRLMRWVAALEDPA